MPLPTEFTIQEIFNRCFDPVNNILLTGGGGGAGVPGGNNTFVQFNDNGVFGGHSGFTYSKASSIATLAGGIKTPKIIPLADSTTALQITKANGVSAIITVDTTNGRIGINTTTPLERLHTKYGHFRMERIDAPMTAPTATVNPAPGNLNGNYSYRISFVTSSGESEASTPTSNVVAPANQQINLTDIPISPLTEVVARKIYRTTAGGSVLSMRLVATINDNTTTTFTDNVADANLGSFAPRLNTTGGIIYANEHKIGVANYGTTAWGLKALKDNAGFWNCAFGENALLKNTTGYRNSALGVDTLFWNETGYRNTAVGNNCLYYSTGSFNTGVGTGVLYFITSGSNNVVVGSDAGIFISGGANLTTCNASIFLGAKVRPLADNSDNEIVIGYEAVGLGNNTVVLGNNSVTLTALRGNVAIKKNSANAGLDIDGYILDSGKSRTINNFSKNDVALTNIPNLSATLEAGKAYRFTVILYVNADIAGGQKYTMSGTATATSITYQINTISNTTNLNVINARRTALNAVAEHVGATESFTQIEGLIVVNTEGTLVPQFAQSVANGTSTVLANSIMIVEQVA